ncbi:hypothetical protein [Haloarchaeobius amylolyticus]|uniref:hypothetical protein n=1 Tax=Haloarchaeobius amylolyticus TaxID=1198296 RepID=UPI002271C8D9|nr:hypothetical protein [Haloarchaeobius amylolyticus]
MPDDNRFAGLSEAVEGEEEVEEPDEVAPDADSEPTQSTESTESTEPTADSASTTEDTESEAESTGEDEEQEEETDPSAFPFDATKKKTVYVREPTIERLEDAQALVDAQLRTEHDVRSLTGREFYDAVFRVAASDTDALIEEIIEAREE